MKQFTIIALGGSIVVPHLTDEGGIDVMFLKKFRSFLLGEIKKGKKFVVIVGGGKTTRVYQKAAEKITNIDKKDLDWIGIAPTRVNAQLLRAIFAKKAYPEIIEQEPSSSIVAKMKRRKESLFFASGWEPGWSTDYVAVTLAKKFGAKEFIDAGDISFVYDKDPKKHKTAKPIKELSWEEYRKLIPKKWTPGLASPIDPIAAQVAQEAGVVAKLINGHNISEFKRALNGDSFTGTRIT